MMVLRGGLFPSVGLIFLGSKRKREGGGEGRGLVVQIVLKGLLYGRETYTACWDTAGASKYFLYE